MEPEQIQPEPQQTGYLDAIKRNKQTLFFVGGAVVIVLILFFLVAISGNKNVKPTIVPKITPAATITSTQKAVTPTISSQSNISSQERASILDQTKPQLQQLITIPYTVSTVKKYGDAWAIMVVNNPNTDPAHVVVKKVNGSWKVMMGPGTHFDAQELQAIGAPQSLIDEANLLN